MFNIGSGELVVIFLVILFVVGPKRLPEIARIIGKTVRYFKNSLEELKEAVEQEPTLDFKEEIKEFFDSPTEPPENER